MQGDWSADDNSAMAVRRQRPSWWLFVVFALLFVAMQWLWHAASNTEIERWVIDGATVHAAVGIVNLITPSVQAWASGSRIAAAGGGINILNGCEGTEVLFLLVAAILAYPLRWRVRALGCILALLLVFGVNQLRLVALFYSFRLDRPLFAELHGLILPLILILIAVAYFMLLLRWGAQSPLPQGLSDEH